MPQWSDPFVAANVVVAVVVLYCSVMSPWKYTRVSGPCSSNWLDVRDPDSKAVCCDESSHAPCYAGMSELHELTHGQGAWILPLVAALVNFGLTMFLPNVTSRHMSAIYNRLGLYFSLMIYRTLVLYGAFNLVEKALFPPATSCWYAPLRRNKRCIDSFDHADHIVLYMTHFIATSCFEWKVLQRDRAVSAFKKYVLSLWLLFVLGLSVYAIFHTAYSFHSCWENIVGMLIAQVFVMLPLYLVSEDYFGALHFGAFLTKDRRLAK